MRSSTGAMSSRSVAGSKALISGKLMGSIKPYTNKNAIFGNQVNDPALLDEILVTDPPHQAFRIRFLELKGRVCGGAELLTDSGGAPGDYPVRIFQRSLGPDPDMPVLRVQIFPDPESLRASQKSLFRRYLGIPPWIVAGLLAPLVAPDPVPDLSRLGRQHQRLAGPGYRSHLQDGLPQNRMGDSLRSGHGPRPAHRRTGSSSSMHANGLRATISWSNRWAASLARRSSTLPFPCGPDGSLRAANRWIKTRSIPLPDLAEPQATGGRWRILALRIFSSCIAFLAQASPTFCIRSSSFTGLSRYSKAPSFIPSTLVSTEA